METEGMLKAFGYFDKQKSSEVNDILSASDKEIMKDADPIAIAKTRKAIKDAVIESHNKE